VRGDVVDGRRALAPCSRTPLWRGVRHRSSSTAVAQGCARSQ
jgi:hypothetical protein